MKLINFHQYKKLSNLLDKMGAELIEMKTNVAWNGIDDEKLRELLHTGELEIDISEIEIVEGVLEYKGRKVIIYIRDQYKKFYDKGYKFHLSNCLTISKAIQFNRKSRYVISLRTDGVFKINLLEEDRIVDKDLLEQLSVCKNCLDNLNYKGYKNNTYSRKNDIYTSFNLTEYFDKYQTSNLSLFNFREEKNTPINTYNKDFSSRSLEFRKSKNYICSECEIDLKNYKKYLHVHHKDGDKSNDNPYNLITLCIECHSRHFGHSRLRYNPDYIEFMKIKSQILIE